MIFLEEILTTVHISGQNPCLLGGGVRSRNASGVLGLIMYIYIYMCVYIIHMNNYSFVYIYIIIILLLIIIILYIQVNKYIYI